MKEDFKIGRLVAINYDSSAEFQQVDTGTVIGYVNDHVALKINENRVLIASRSYLTAIED